VLEAAARRAVAAWAQAIDGDDAALRALATPGAVRQLLHPGDPTARTRLVVRGPRLHALRIVALDAHARPPTLTVEADLRGRRYREDRDTLKLLAGSRQHDTAFTERWQLALDHTGAQPWRLTDADAGNPRSDHASARRRAQSIGGDRSRPWHEPTTSG
jgi:predicted lipid-binding transport protein (Tim44 family)